MKIYFKSITELQEKFPVGSVVSEKKEIHESIEYYYNDIDLNYLKTIFNQVEILDNNRCYCRSTEITTKKVEGYIFNGKVWMPAYDTWDGWYPYEEEDFDDR